LTASDLLKEPAADIFSSESGNDAMSVIIPLVSLIDSRVLLRIFPNAGESRSPENSTMAILQAVGH
jgi:hypothetical protein